MTSRKYWAAADVIRVTATLAVIGVHLSGIHVRTNTSYDVEWWSLAALESLSIWAVPGFIMLSGALLLGGSGKQSTTTFYRKRLTKIGIPMVFWVVAHILWANADIPYADPGSRSWFHTVGLFKYLLFGYVSWHLYFLFLIAGLYVVAPMLRILIAQISPREELYVVIAALAYASVYTTTNMYLGQGGMNVFSQWAPYVGYFIGGHYIYKHASWGPGRYACLAVLGFLLVLCGKYVEMRIHGGKLTHIFGGYSSNYFSISVMSLSLGMFGTIVSWDRTRGFSARVSRVCQTISPATFGIFLVHIMVWTALREFGVVEGSTNAWGTALLVLLLAFTSFSVTLLIGSVPVLRSVVDCNTQSLWKSLRSNDEPFSDPIVEPDKEKNT